MNKSKYRLIKDLIEDYKDDEELLKEMDNVTIYYFDEDSLKQMPNKEYYQRISDIKKYLKAKYGIEPIYNDEWFKNYMYIYKEAQKLNDDHYDDKESIIHNNSLHYSFSSGIISLFEDINCDYISYLESKKEDGTLSEFGKDILKYGDDLHKNNSRYDLLKAFKDRSGLNNLLTDYAYFREAYVTYTGYQMVKANKVIKKEMKNGKKSKYNSPRI